MILKQRFLDWLILKLFESNIFNEFIDSKIVDFYKYNSLNYYRVWGDETKIIIGKNVQINNALMNTVSGQIEIEDYTFFGHNVSLLTGTHDGTKCNLERQFSVPGEGRNIKIGKGVWIASNAIVYGPCTIGDNAVIAAGAIVTGNVEAGAFYSGNLAKKIKILDIK